jgi:hypothetical protein
MGRAVSNGLTATFAVLTATDTDAAARVLDAALESPRDAIHEAALTATLKRRNLAGQRIILQQWESMPPRWREIVERNRDRMTPVLREAVVGADMRRCAQGCAAAVALQQYELIPALLNAIGDPLNPNADLIASTLMGLAEQLYGELASGAVRGRRDPQITRQHVISSLETWVLRYARHRRREVIEAFLLLVNRENVSLKQILQEPHHDCLPVVLDVLAKSTRNGVMRLLLGLLDDPHAPLSALTVVGNRTDATFLRYLLRKVGREPSAAARQNLKRLTSVAWLQAGDVTLDELDDAGQHAAVRLVTASGISRVHAFSTIEYLLDHGRPGGRRAAAEALNEFQGAQANALALRAMEDSDPVVQSTVILQLRRRGIPSVLARLVEMLESPHSMVRQAARKSLAEFSFKRYLAAFDILDEEVRQSTGQLVKKVDSHTIPLLQAEFRARARTRRLRAVAIARAIEVVAEVEADLIELLHDEDHVVRIEAAAALAAGVSEASVTALQETLADRSAAVVDAVRRSLASRMQFTQLRAAPDTFPDQTTNDTMP